tara:strand:+ start:750 stop:1214 length:465 start_codon:yes stop_codon:yes gene_type:complete
MRPNSKTQMDQGLGFDGAGKESTGSVRGGLHVNKWSGHMNDGRLVNKGRGPTTGNNGMCDTPKNVGASVTKDAHRQPPTAATPSLPAQGSVRDNINRGAQVRGSGMTAVRKPSNPDSIRIGQGGGTSYGAVTKGSRPVAPGSTGGINYGPKSQY